MWTIAPESERSLVVLHPRGLPGASWLLRLPEYGYGRQPLTGVRWTVASHGQQLQYRWTPPPGQEEALGVAYEGELRAEGRRSSSVSPATTSPRHLGGTTSRRSSA